MRVGRRLAGVARAAAQQRPGTLGTVMFGSSRRSDFSRIVLVSRVRHLSATDRGTMATKWATRAPAAGLLHLESNRFRGMKSFSKEKRMVWQVRSNTWMGTALRKRFGFATQNNAPTVSTSGTRKLACPAA